MTTTNETLTLLCDESLTAVVGGTPADEGPGCGGFGDGTPYPTEPPTVDAAF